LPHDDLVQVCNIHKPHVLITSFITPPLIPLERYLKKLARSFPAASILVSGLQARAYRGAVIGNVRIFQTATELNARLEA
ncbi:MAG TPA: hypothetical protein VD816_07385, partial [Ohtaekwangia sp.]|nr:hypothetical protein [Ohtaekwangia sp.]